MGETFSSPKKNTLVTAVRPAKPAVAMVACLSEVIQESAMHLLSLKFKHLLSRYLKSKPAILEVFQTSDLLNKKKGAKNSALHLLHGGRSAVILAYGPAGREFGDVWRAVGICWDLGGLMNGLISFLWKMWFMSDESDESSFFYVFSRVGHNQNFETPKGITFWHGDCGAADSLPGSGKNHSLFGEDGLVVKTSEFLEAAWHIDLFYFKPLLEQNQQTLQCGFWLRLPLGPTLQMLCAWNFSTLRETGFWICSERNLPWHSDGWW